MINFNFLGLGTSSAAQQKGKTNGVIGADSEKGLVAMDGESLMSDATFPNVLMQMLLGQQLPINAPVKTGQQSNPSQTSADGEILPSVKPLFTTEQAMPLQEQSLAGEMKKQSAIQKASAQILISGDGKILSDQPENIEIAKLSLIGLNSEAEVAKPKQQTGSAESLQTMVDTTINLEGMDILSSQIPSNVIQRTLSTQGEENKNITTGNGKQKENIAVKPNADIFDMGSLPKLTKPTDTEPVAKETKFSNLTQNKSSLKTDNLFLNEIVQPSGDIPSLNLPNKQEIIGKELQYKTIESNEEIKIENTSVIKDAGIKTNPQSLKNPLVNNEIVDRNNTFEVKQANNRAPIKEQDFISITSSDILQKGILSAVVTQSGKITKNENNASTTIDKSSSTEKQSSSVSSIEIDKPITNGKNETQNSGSGSFTPKENMDRQISSEKNSAAVDTRQGQQQFSSVIEEKNNMVVSKTHQTDISSFLKQQDAVNTIVEQLAKNVKFSIDGNNSQIKISLKPEALGEVMLKVTIEQGKVSTQMEVQQPQIKAVIEANLQILRDSLSSKGLVVDKIDISTAQYSLNEKSSGQGQQRSNLKNYSGKEIVEEVSEQTKLFGYNTVDYVA